VTIHRDITIFLLNVSASSKWCDSRGERLPVRIAEPMVDRFASAERSAKCGEAWECGFQRAEAPLDVDVDGGLTDNDDGLESTARPTKTHLDPSRYLLRIQLSTLRISTAVRHPRLHHLAVLAKWIPDPGPYESIR